GREPGPAGRGRGSGPGRHRSQPPAADAGAGRVGGALPGFRGGPFKVREQMETLTGLEGGQGFRYVLARTDFRLVWFAQLAGQSADKFVMFSLIILAYGLVGANTHVAVTLLPYTLPALFLPPFAGVYADRHNRKTTMVWTNLGRAAMVALIPISALLPGLRNDLFHLLLIT